MNEERKALLKKMNAFRQDLLECDWTPDKKFMINDKPKYPYVSVEKVKANFAPLIAKHGLEVKLEFSDLQGRAAIGLMSQHWTVKCRMTMIDIDTGESESFEAYGEAGDAGDKAIGKAQTHALKQIIFQNYMVADNSDPDDVCLDNIVPVRAKSIPNPGETEAALERVMESSVKPNVPATPPKPMPSPVPEPSQSTPTPQPVPMPSPKMEVPSPAHGSVVSFPPSPMQNKAINKIVADVEAKVKAGEMTQEEAGVVYARVRTIETSDDAREFLEGYQK